MKRMGSGQLQYPSQTVHPLFTHYLYTDYYPSGAVCADWNIVDTLDRQLEILGRGRVKLEDLQTAMLGMREAVQMFAQFWSNEATLLSRTLQESLEGKLSMSQQDAVEYALSLIHI